MYKEALIKSVNLWSGEILSGILPSFKNNPTLTKVNNIMGAFLGIDLSNYNIMSEFSFLIPSMIGKYVEGYINQFLDALKIQDADIPEQVNTVLDSCIQRCREKGFINIFGLQFEAEAFSNLKEIFRRTVENTNMV
jgi:hypothetical protein